MTKEVIHASIYFTVVFQALKSDSLCPHKIPNKASLDNISL